MGYKDILNIRKHYALLYAFYGMALLMTFLELRSLCITHHLLSFLPLMIGTGFCLIFGLSSLIAIRSVKDDARHLVLSGWIKLLHQSPMTYPLNDVERKKLVLWAEETLRPFAEDVTRAFDARDDANLRMNATRDFQEKAQRNDDACSPNDLTIFRELRRKAITAEFHAEQHMLHASGYAGDMQKRYLKAWDLLVHPEPKGIGILAKYENADPDKIRKQLSAHIEQAREEKLAF